MRPPLIVFEEQPPSFVYFDEQCDVAVSIPDTYRDTLQSTIQLHVICRYTDSNEIAPGNVIQIVPLSSKDLQLSAKNSSCRFSCTFYEALVGRVVRLEVQRLEVQPIFGRPTSARSTPVVVVREKLVITQQAPELWFKDEGGRDKCMQIDVTLEAASGEKCQDRVVPLNVQLYYTSGERVTAQHILRLFPDLQPSMVNRFVRILFRIDDVSKNHQGQSFTLVIGPDIKEVSTYFQDIAPVKTNAIAVRSKRNKRKCLRSELRPENAIRFRRSPHTLTTLPNTNHAIQKSSENISYHVTYKHNVQSLVEWSVIGFEIFPNGKVNTDRPIYRCCHCHRLIDCNRLSAKSMSDPSIHEISCPIFSNYEEILQSNNSLPIRKHKLPTNSSELCEHRRVLTNGDGKPNLIANERSFVGMKNLEGDRAVRNTFAALYDHPIGEQMHSMHQHSGPKAHDGIEDAMEERVYIIVSKMFTNHLDEMLGLPAYDDQEQLLGFYLERKNKRSTEMEFVPISSVFINEKEWMFLMQLLQRLKQGNAPTVHYLFQYAHNIVLLRENALMSYWTESMCSAST